MTRSSHHNPRYASGSFTLSYHLEMLSDQERVDRCKQAILAALRQIGPQAVFCELGCGTGFFSIFAARHCQHVYAIEGDPIVLRVAEENIRELGLLDRIALVPGDALKVSFPSEPISVLFCEMMSIWLITEPQVPVLRRWVSHYANSLRHIIPRRVINLAELAQVDYQFDSLEIKTHLPQFSGIRPPRIMTESRVVHSISFLNLSDLSDRVVASCEFVALVEGYANCARISSIVEFFPGVIFHSTDTLMPTTVVPLEDPIAVRSGDRLRLSVCYDHRSDLDSAQFRATVIR